MNLNLGELGFDLDLATSGELGPELSPDPEAEAEVGLNGAGVDILIGAGYRG